MTAHINPLDALTELEKAAAEVHGNRTFHQHIANCAKIVADALMGDQIQAKITEAAKKADE